jgi:lipopolysaccharide heptosyltransferase I
VKILILKPSSLGDVIQALPVLRHLKRHLPRGKIYWWIKPSLAPLLEEDPDLDGIILFERQRWRSPRNWLEIWRSIRKLRAENFDWVIDLQGLARSGAFAWLANGKLTVGLDEPREGARGLYDIIVRRPSYHTHAVDWYLETLSALGVPRAAKFEWIPPKLQAAESLRRKWPSFDAGEKWIALQPGARWLNKRWPVEHFQQLVKLLVSSNPRARFIVLGGAEDQLLGSAIAKSAPEVCLDYTGKLTLPEMIEALRLCECLVTNDTGPMHVAAALGTRVIGLFGPTEPRRTGPYGQIEATLQSKALPCVPCMKSTCSWPQPIECLRSLTPAFVAQATGLIGDVSSIAKMGQTPLTQRR